MNSIEKTLRHIRRVNELLGQCAVEFIQRGARHDSSKFSEAELEPLKEIDALIEREGQAPFGSDEYERRRQMLKPMLDHHYARNSHHPEHYENGVNGMDLFDVLEMVCDWKAASERGEESSINLKAACDRFGIDAQMQEVITNHCLRQGWKLES